MGAAAEPPAAQEPACPAQPTGPEQGEAAAGEGHPPAGKAAPVVQGCDPVAAEASASSADGLGGVGRSSDPRRPQDGGKAAAKEQPSGGGSGGGPGPGSRTQTGAGISTGGLDAGAGPAGGASAGLEVAEGGVQVERRNEYNAFCRWSLTEFSKIKARALWSRYFEVGGYDCRLLVYPRGDSQALPGYISVYLQVTDPRSSNTKWDCFASYRLSVANQRDESKSICRDSWHRFSSKKKSHGWCDFTPSSAVLDPRAGFFVNDTMVITADILVLHESVTFTRDVEAGADQSVGQAGASEVLGGKFSWKVHNFSLFKEMIKTQKIMSPVFPVGECSLRLSVYQSNVSGVEYLSMCMESKDTEKAPGSMERSCWCLFRTSVMNQLPSHQHMHRDSYGRRGDANPSFAADNKSGDNTSLGWNDFMRMSDFCDDEAGYLVEDTAVFAAGFHIIKESCTFNRMNSMSTVLRKLKGYYAGDNFQGKFTWRIDHFTRLKDILKKRKITGLCIKSKRFQVGGRDCRLIVYPRGQSQPPMHLSMFLEVTDLSNMSDWSCFVSHRLSVVNQRNEAERSMTKESQNRYSKSAKDWGWREFVTLTALFDQDSGFLVNDSVVFSAEVLILKETSEVKELPPLPPLAKGRHSSQDVETDEGDASLPALAVAPPGGAPPPPGHVPGSSSCSPVSFTWKVENFMSFKEIMETRKIFSRYFSAGGCELRIGVYESFETLCIYLESDSQAASCSSGNGNNGTQNNSHTTPSGPSAGIDPERNFWVRYCIGVINLKNPQRTVWKESSICTKTWNNSVLQFMKMNELLDPEAGFLIRDTVILGCEVLDCCPWFEFADLEVYASDDDREALSTDPDELLDSDDSDDSGFVSDEDVFCAVLSRCRAVMNYLDSPPQVADPAEFQAMLVDKLQADTDLLADFLAGLRSHLEDPPKLYALMTPTISPTMDSRKAPASGFGMMPHLMPPAPSLLSLLMGIKALQLPIVDMLLDITIAACQNHRLAVQAEWATEESDQGEEQGQQTTHEAQSRNPCMAENPPGSTAEGQEGRPARSETRPDGPDRDRSIPAGDEPLPSGAAGQKFEGPQDPHVENTSDAGPTSSTGFPPFMSFPLTSGSASFHPGFAHSQQPSQLQGLRTPPTSSVQFPDPFAGWMFSDTPGPAMMPTPAGFAPSSATASSVPASEQADALGAADELLSMVVNALRSAVCLLDPDISLGGDGCLGEGGAGAASNLGDARLTSAPLSEAHFKAGRGGKGGKRRGCKGRRADSASTASSSSVQADSELDAVTSLAAHSPTVHRISLLLASAPCYLQPDIILLVPRLVEPAEHTAAAGALLGHLAEASREGPEVEAELRMPVLAALGLLRIDPLVADKVLQAALDALPSLSEAELPPAVGLVLKLASQSDRARPAAVQAVRKRLEAAGSAVSAGTLDAVRLAVQQHPTIAAAFFADIDEGLRTAQGQPPGRGRGKHLGEEGPASSSSRSQVPLGHVKGGQPNPSTFGTYRGMPQGAVDSSSAAHVADVEVLLDLCRMPDFQDDAEQLFEKSIAKGLITELELVAVLERRRMQQLVASTLPSQLFGAAPPSLSAPAGSSSLQQGLPMARGFMPPPDGALSPGWGLPPPHTSPSGSNFQGSVPFQAPSAFPLGMPPLLSQLSLGASAHLGLGIAGLPLGLMGFGDLGGYSLLPVMGSDDFEASLGLAEALMNSKAQRAKTVVIALYGAIFRLCTDQASRDRLLQGLVNRVTGIEARPEKSVFPDGRTTKLQQGASKSQAGKSAASKKQAMKAAKDVLLSLLEEYSVCAKPALDMLLAAVSDLTTDKSRLESRVLVLESELQAHQNEMGLLRSSADKAREHGLDQIKDLEVALAKLQQERSAEAERMAEERKDLEGKLRETERQADWARGERDEEVDKAAREKRDLVQRLRDSEQQVAKLKNTKRDELKRLTKEKAALLDRLKALEGTQRRYEEEMRRLVEDKARADKEAERALAADAARVQAEKLAASQGDRLAKAKTYIDTLESKAASLQSYATNLESNLKEEMTRHAPLYGAGLDSLHDSELGVLMRIHDDGIKRIQAIFAQRQHEESTSQSVSASLGLAPSLSSLSAVAAPAAPPVGPAAAGAIGFGRAIRSSNEMAAIGGLGVGSLRVDPAATHVGDLLGGGVFAPTGGQPQGPLLHPSGSFQNGFGGLGTGFGNPPGRAAGSSGGSNMW